MLRGLQKTPGNSTRNLGFQLQIPELTNFVGLLQADNMINRKLVTVVHNNVVKEIQSQEVNIIFQRQFWFPHFLQK